MMYSMGARKSSLFWPVVVVIVLLLSSYGVWLRYGTERGIEIQLQYLETQITQAYFETKADYADIPKREATDKQIPLAQMSKREDLLERIEVDLSDIQANEISKTNSDKAKVLTERAQLVSAFSSSLREFYRKSNPADQNKARGHERQFLELTPEAAKGGHQSVQGNRFKSCQDARDQGFGPFVQGVDSEYYIFEDADGDGVVCEGAN